MNEQIKELAKKAGAIPIHGKPKDLALVGLDNIEKYTKMIVQECCSIADEVERADTGMFVSKYIKAHFGVE